MRYVNYSTDFCRCIPPGKKKVLNKHNVCSTCLLRLYGKSQNPLQRLAAERNWRRAQLLGMRSQIDSIGLKLKSNETAGDIRYKIDRMLQINDNDWQAKRGVLLAATQFQKDIS